MTPSPFDPSFDELPATLPVFPLPGVLLLPRGKLPLNIFEPRYLNMTRDALATDRLIGMIQPKPAEGGHDAGARCLYRIGCAGRITQFTETDDGRFLVTLTGVCRFSVDEEIASMRGYRRVIADWGPFSRDLSSEGEADLDRGLLVSRLKQYFDTQGITADWNVIEQTPDHRLVTTLAMVCPFESSEKQALLECDSLKARASMMLALLDMAVAGTNGGDHARH